MSTEASQVGGVSSFYRSDAPGGDHSGIHTYSLKGKDSKKRPDRDRVQFEAIDHLHRLTHGVRSAVEMDTRTLEQSVQDDGMC
jgi:hypothetical protein